MSSPILWIVSPVAAALLLLAFVQRDKLAAGIGAGFSLLLAFLAWVLPFGTPIDLGFFSFHIASSLEVLGRRLVLDQGDAASLTLIFLITAIWFIGSGMAAVQNAFGALGLAVAGFLVAGLAVEPFLYAALLIEIAVLISIPILSPPGARANRGTLRYLIMQTLGMPFILFTGWMLSGVEGGPVAPGLAARAAVLLGLGFAFLLAIFPFYTWIPLLGEQAHPYAAGFIFTLLPTVALLFALNFLDRYAWLRDNGQIYTLLQYTGALMAATGGIWAAFQKHLGRMMGYAVILETGLSLLAIGVGLGPGLELFAMLFLPRILALGVMAFALALLVERVGSLDLDQLGGLVYRFPLAGIGLLLAIFSLAGLPLLAGFPVRQALLESVARGSPGSAFWGLVGGLGLFVAGLRVLAVFIRGGAGERLSVGEAWPQAVVMAVGGSALVLAGLLPQWFVPAMLGLLAAFPTLMR